MEASRNSGPDGPGSDYFDTTHWSVILEAAREGSTQAHQALDKLCQRYWRPLYAFARRHGHSEPDAQDLTQGFFAQFVGKEAVRRADPDRGRFRTFLLTSFQRFITGEWEKSRAFKRGAGPRMIPLDALSQSATGAEPILDPAAGEFFDRAWAEQLFSVALTKLREEFDSAGQAREFTAMRAFLSAPGTQDAYAQASRALGVKPDSVPVVVHRMRRRYGELVRAEVARTVNTTREVDAELKYLIELMNR